MMGIVEGRVLQGEGGEALWSDTSRDEDLTVVMIAFQAVGDAGHGVLGLDRTTHKVAKFHKVFDRPCHVGWDEIDDCW